MKPFSFRTASAALVAVAAAAALATMSSAATPKFLSDDPIQVEHDSQDASSMKATEVNLFVDFAYNVITGRGPIEAGRARNVNTVDEVADSSWFTNRAGARQLTAEEIANGPDTSAGPAPGIWSVTASKSDGVTPGFTVKDSKGQRWFIKFDPPGSRGMATGTEVAVTKLFWALGYNVAENHIAYLHRDQLVVADGATFTPADGGKRRAMRLTDIDHLLQRADREPDGSYRVVASKALEGKPIGRIRFIGTRPDDPNDIVAHEDRRELRGYGTFAAWLNHVDAKSINTLDMLVTKNGRSFVRHNLLDFGSALGSGGVAPSEFWEGHQYLVEPGLAGKQMAGFGLAFPKWEATPYYESPAVGRLPKHNADFDPETWKPREPNRAFLYARGDDKFWAARKLMAISTELIRAAVKTGEFGNREDEEFLVRALAERRDAIGRAYLSAVNPIVDVALAEDGTLTFRNAAVEADVAKAPQSYRAAWFRFDNATSQTTQIGQTTGRTTEIEAPAGVRAADGEFIKVQLSAAGTTHAAWEAPVDVYFRRASGAWQLVGLERMPDGPRAVGTN